MKKYLALSSLLALTLIGAGCSSGTSSTSTSTASRTNVDKMANSIANGGTSTPNGGSAVLANTTGTTKTTTTTKTGTTKPEPEPDFTGTIAPSGATGTTGAVIDTLSANYIAYSKALQTYNLYGNRFQFASCRSLPGKITMKKNTRFMLDNRDPKKHVFKVGTVTFNIPGWAYAIIKVNRAGVFTITCDGGGSAQVTVQN